jgi:hypothetical protein
MNTALKIIFPLMVVIGASYFLISSVGNVWNAQKELDQAKRELWQAAYDCIQSDGYETCLTYCTQFEDVEGCRKNIEKVNAEMSNE